MSAASTFTYLDTFTANFNVDTKFSSPVLLDASNAKPTFILAEQITVREIMVNFKPGYLREL